MRHPVSHRLTTVVFASWVGFAAHSLAAQYSVAIDDFSQDFTNFTAGATEEIVPLTGGSDAPAGTTIEARAVYTAGSSNSKLLDGVLDGDDWETVLDKMKANAPAFYQHILSQAEVYDPTVLPGVFHASDKRYGIGSELELELVGKDLAKGFEVKNGATLRLKNCVIRGPILRNGTGNLIIEDCVINLPGDGSAFAQKKPLGLGEGAGQTYVDGLFITGWGAQDALGRSRDKTTGANNRTAVLKAIYVDAPSPGPNASGVHVDIFQFGGADATNSHAGTNIDTDISWSVFMMDPAQRIFSSGPQDDAGIAINDAFYLENLNGTLRMRHCEITTAAGRPINVQGPDRGRMDAAFLRLIDDNNSLMLGSGDALLQDIYDGTTGADVTASLVAQQPARLQGTGVVAETGADARAPLITDLPAIDWAAIATTDANGDWSGSITVPHTEFWMVPQARIQGSAIMDEGVNRFGSGHSPIDSEAPTAPSGLMVDEVTTNSISIGWDASTDNIGVVGYRVYVDGVWLESVSATSITLTELEAETSYAIRVSAYDAAGNESIQSVPLNTMTAALPQDRTIVGFSFSNSDLVAETLDPNLTVIGQTTNGAASFPEAGTLRINKNGTSMDFTFVVEVIAGYEMVVTGLFVGQEGQKRSNTREASLYYDTGSGPVLLPTTTHEPQDLDLGGGQADFSTDQIALTGLTGTVTFTYSATPHPTNADWILLDELNLIGSVNATGGGSTPIEAPLLEIRRLPYNPDSSTPSIELQWHAQRGFRYQLETSTDLVNWSDATEIPVITGDNAIEILSLELPKPPRYYRLNVSQSAGNN